MNQNSSMLIGFLGLGNMGAPIAGRLIAAGYQLIVYNRSAEKADALVKQGAKLARTPRELAHAPIVISMLADDKAMEAVTWGNEGFLGGFQKGSTHVAMSTISVELSKKLALAHEKAGTTYIAAPVLGRPDAAEAGKLFIFAGGTQADIDKNAALFSTLGQKTFPVLGEAWRAHLIKLACNFMLQGAIEAMAESFALVRKGGLDASLFYDIFSTTLFNAPVYKNYGSMMVDERYIQEKGFKMPLARKDTTLALDAAKELGVPLPMAELIYDQITQAIDRGQSDLDLSGLGKVAAENAGLK